MQQVFNLDGNVEIVLPSSPEDHKALKAGLVDVSNSMTRVKYEQEYISEALKALGEKFDIKPKYLRKMASIYFKNSFDEIKHENTEIEDAYEGVFNLSKGDGSDFEDA